MSQFIVGSGSPCRTGPTSLSRTIRGFRGRKESWFLGHWKTPLKNLEMRRKFALSAGGGFFGRPRPPPIPRGCPPLRRGRDLPADHAPRRSPGGHPCRPGGKGGCHFSYYRSEGVEKDFRGKA